MDTIDDYAFFHCRRLASIALPASLRYLGASSLYGCTRLTSITLPNSITAIQEYTFGYCWGLNTVVILPSVAHIGSNAFYDCTEISSLTCQATTPPTVADASAFEDIYGTATLYVPERSVALYQAAPVWQQFSSISALQPEFIPGDIDSDGRITIVDITTLIDILLQGGPNESPAADVDGDGSISIGDITAIIDLLLTNNE